MAAIFLAAMSRETRGILFTVFTKCGGPNREDDSGAWFWGGDVGTAESSGAVGEVAGGRERLPEGAGGRREPEQRWPTGPCTRTNPALVTRIIRRQTLQGARIVEESRAVSSAILTYFSNAITFPTTIIHFSHVFQTKFAEIS